MSLAETLASFNDRHSGRHIATRAGRDGEVIIGLSGELDMETAGELEPLLEAIIPTCPEHGRLILDLSRVGYIASTGVGLLTSLLVKAQALGISLILLDIPPRVRNIMNVLGLLPFFTQEWSENG